MEAFRLILTRLLPKTEQVTEYVPNDDGVKQFGWWQGKLVADNYDRFIQKTINGDVVVIDRATGLMWAADGSGAGCYDGERTLWTEAVNYAEELTFAGYQDWYLPNIFQLLSLQDGEFTNPCIKEPPFSNTVVGEYWSSTTRADDTLKAIAGRTYYIGSCFAYAKLNNFYIRYVRNL